MNIFLIPFRLQSVTSAMQTKVDKLSADYNKATRQETIMINGKTRNYLERDQSRLTIKIPLTWKSN